VWQAILYKLRYACSAFVTSLLAQRSNQERAPLCDRSAAQGLALRELRRVLLNAVALVLRLWLEQRFGVGIYFYFFRDRGAVQPSTPQRMRHHGLDDFATIVREKMLPPESGVVFKASRWRW